MFLPNIWTVRCQCYQAFMKYLKTWHDAQQNVCKAWKAIKKDYGKSRDSLQNGYDWVEIVFSSCSFFFYSSTRCLLQPSSRCKFKVDFRGTLGGSRDKSRQHFKSDEIVYRRSRKEGSECQGNIWGNLSQLSRVLEFMFNVTVGSYIRCWSTRGKLDSLQ